MSYILNTIHRFLKLNLLKTILQNKEMMCDYGPQGFTDNQFNRPQTLYYL